MKQDQMKLTIIHTDRQNQLYLSTKTMERFLERILRDDSKDTIARFREVVPCLTHGYDGYKDIPTWSHVLPAAEFAKDENGNLQMKRNNGLLLFTFSEIEGQEGVEVAKQKMECLPSTLAAFVGADGITLHVLVRYEPLKGNLPDEETAANRLYQCAFQHFAPLYQSLLSAKLCTEDSSVRSDFLMTFDSVPYYNPDAAPLKVCDSMMDGEEAKSATEMLQVENGKDGISVMIAYLKKRYKFRYNSVMKFTEYKPLDHEWWGYQPVDSRVNKRMTLEVQQQGINVSIKDVRNYLESDYIKNYNPIEDFLFSCYDKWDGKDHIRALARTVPTDNPHWEDWFYTWFLGMVDQWRGYSHRQYGNSVAPLLISKQGYNKSTFCRRLLPMDLQWGYTDNLILSEKRQVLQAMAQSLLINLDEFNQISPQVQQGFLKNLIQLPSVKMKPPYGSHVMEFPRLASFIATSNMTDLLSDPSGNRRFIGIELTGPIDVSVRPNYEQLYAQALEALHAGEKSYFDADQTQLLMDSNKKFEVLDPIVQYFRMYFEVGSSEQEDGAEFLATAEIFDYLKKRLGSSVKVNSMVSFGRFLSQQKGIIRKRTAAGTKYLVRKIM